MQPTLYASYRDAEHAEIVVGALLEAGVAPEDISLIVKNDSFSTYNRELTAVTEPLAMVDAGQSGVPMIGREDRETYGSYVYEAPVGGGIDTSTPDDAAESIDQADEGQELAEDMIYPVTEASYGSNEAMDVAEAANNKFFNTTKPGPDGLSSATKAQIDATPEEDALSALHVPGVGYVLGGGALATEVIGAGMAAEAGGNPAASLAEYLMDQRLNKELAVSLTEDFGRGGAILAVAVPPGTAIGMDQVEQLLEGSKACNLNWVDR